MLFFCSCGVEGVSVDLSEHCTTRRARPTLISRVRVRVVMRATFKTALVRGPHRAQRCSAAVHFNKGQLAYKPNSLANFCH